jgi:signal transduction histidine kinase/DNA-binding NarL/FixJ family response regulator
MDAMSRRRSLSRTYLVTMLTMAIVPVLLCGYLWLSDPRGAQSIQPANAPVAGAPPVQSSPQPLLQIGGVALGMLLLALLAAHYLTLRSRRALRDFADHFAEVSRSGGQLDGAYLTELQPLVQGMNRVIAERAHIERELRGSEQRFQLALEAAGCHLWDIDLQAGTVIMGPSLFRYLGRAEAVRPLSMDEALTWIHPDDVGRVLASLKGLPVEQQGLELRLRDSGGDYCWFSCRGGVVELDARGRPLRALGTAADITSRKLIEQELIAARVAAEDANHAKSQFLSSVSHELRTPLNGVLGYAQILLRDPAATPEQRHHLGAIESCGQHLLTLINDVLDLAKIESGRLELNESVCDLYRLLQSVSDIVRERADSKLLDFNLEIAPEVPAEVVLDEVKLRQILVNLLSNAVKFTDSGDVSLRVRCRGGGRELLFQVNDTGVGIPVERQQEIFLPFRQAAASVDGTGLGLAISLRLCELMGGHIAVQSAVGTGSTFSFALPCRAAVSASGTRQPAALRKLIDSDGEGPRVLVADDNPTNRHVLAGMLRSSGIEAVEAENGREVLALLRRERLPLVLMDLRMPELDGIEATRAIKADPALRDTRVIAVSASVFPEVVAQMRASGCDDFISKPVRVEELLAKVAQQLQLPLRDARLVESRADRRALRQLPEPMLRELRAAVALGDLEALRVQLAPLRQGSAPLPTLAQRLDRLIDDCEIEVLRDLLAPDREIV